MAEEVGSLRVGLSIDSAKFEQSLASVDRNLKALGGEMAIIRAKGNDWGNSIEGLGSKQKTLTTLLESQDVKVRKLNEAYQKAVVEQGENSKAAENLAIKINKATAEYTKTETELNSVTSALSKLETEAKQNANVWNKLGESMREAGDKLKAVGTKMTDVGKDLSMKLTLPILGVGAAALKTATDFEAQMDRVGAIAGATSEEMAKMNAVALELGASTSKSASEVAKGMEELAAMGFTATEVIGAMPGVISAAEASGSDMAQTAEVMASTLNIFGLEAAEANRVADILAKTANISAASLTDMQYALKYAGPPAAALGISLEELSAGIGIMTNAGMKGEQAGTTLRGALLGLLDPSEENSKRMSAMGIAITDNEGNFVGLSNLINNLTESMEGQTETQKAATISALVGKEAVSGMLSLMAAGPAEIDKMTLALKNSGGASAEAAAIMRDNLKGALDELGGAFETAGIEIGATLTPIIRDIAAKIQELVQKFIELSPTVQKVILIIAGLAAAIGPLLVVFGFMATALGSALTLFGTISGAIAVVTTGVAAATPAIGALATVFTVLTGPIGLAIAAIGLLVAAGVVLYKNWDVIKERATTVWTAISKFFATTTEGIRSTFTEKFNSIKSFITTWVNSVKTIFTEVWNVIKNIFLGAILIILDIITGDFGAIKGHVAQIMGNISVSISTIWNTIKSMFSTSISTIKTTVTNGFQSLVDTMRSRMENAREAIQAVWSTVQSFFTDIDLKQIGKDIIQGLIDGIGSMAGAVWDKVGTITDGIKNAITGALQIKSPSRITMGYGENIGQGLVLGMKEMQRAVQRESNLLAVSATPSINGNQGVNNSRSYTGNTVINVHSSNLSPSEIARKQQQAQRQMALEWGY